VAVADDIAQWLEGPGLEFSPGVADDEVRALRLTLGRHLVEEM
jgi:hypothetical protein